MLVVDPMKRITIPEIRQHPWFQYKLPAYLRLPPEQMEKQERVIDEECIAEVRHLSALHTHTPSPPFSATACFP
jgi:5'-AMP-activated protein kinase catalytic alpha subunit